MNVRDAPVRAVPVRQMPVRHMPVRELPTATTRVRAVRLRRVAVAVALLGIGGCALAPQPALDRGSVRAIEQELTADLAANRSGRASAEASARVAANSVLVPPLAGADAAFTERFNVSVAAMPAQDFFRGLVADTKYNVVVHPDVKGTVSLSLKHVTLDEVMGVMREVYGYDYARVGTIYRVYPDALRTEIFQIDYLDVTRRGVSEMQVSAGKLSGGGPSRRRRRDPPDRPRRIRGRAPYRRRPTVCRH